MKYSVNKVIGQNIKTLRTFTNMTQAKLAEMLKVSIATMSLYEKGERSVPLDSLLILSRIFNVSIDDMFSVSTFEHEKDHEVYFEHFKFGSSTIFSSGETRISNPHSMYFTLTDLNGDTLLFLRATEVTEGLMLISESQIIGSLDKVDANSLKNKRLFLTTISVFERIDGKEPIYTYVDHNGKKLVMKNKAMFIYYGYLIARIKHTAKTEEIFFNTNS